ncbi:MAG: hypothetical protein R3E86_19065 [Pseudomonadales bacterium]
MSRNDEHDQLPASEGGLSEPALDALLLQLREHRAPPGLAARIMATVPEADALQRLGDWLVGALWRPALLALVPLLLGFVLGTSVTRDYQQSLSEEVLSLAFVDLAEELGDAR